MYLIKRTNLPHVVLVRLPVKLLLALVCALTISLNAQATEIPTSAEDINPILVGQKIPELTLVNAKGEAVNLKKLFAQKHTLMIVYRGGWCPYCNTHLADLRKIEGKLKDMGFQIVALSPDQPKFLQQTGTKNELGYTLLSDSSMKAAKALGLAFKVDDKTLEKYDEYGIDLEKNSGEKHHLLPVPAALLVDKDSAVTFSFVAPNYKVRVDNDVILAAAKSQMNTENSK